DLMPPLVMIEIVVGKSSIIVTYNSQTNCFVIIVKHRDGYDVPPVFVPPPGFIPPPRPRPVFPDFGGLPQGIELDEDQLKDLNPWDLKEFMQAKYLQAVLDLHDLKDKTKGFHCAKLGESKIDDVAVLRMKVTKEGQPDIELFFDKNSSLLIKAECRDQLN